jgi:hypothetical protein
MTLSNNTVSRFIAGITADVEEQLNEKLRNKCFSIHIDEMTDCSDVGHLMNYM